MQSGLILSLTLEEAKTQRGSFLQQGFAKSPKCARQDPRLWASLQGLIQEDLGADTSLITGSHGT